MKMDVIQIADRGIAGKERLVLRVLSDADLSYFIVLATKYTSPQAITNAARFTHWFASKPVKAGDWVILYTGIGTASEKRQPDGNNAYFIYWGLPSPIWTTTGDCAVLLEINTWKASRYE